MKIAGIVDSDTAIGLKLAGIKNIFVPDNEIIKSIWFELIDREDIGIIIITEDIVEKIKKEVQDFRLQHNIPIIMEIPDKKGRKEGHVDYISELIKKAVGVQVNKKQI